MLENLRRSIVMQAPGSLVQLGREEALRIIELAQQAGVLPR
jgi:hypothetical protein